jgi:hypothetical protein
MTAFAGPSMAGLVWCERPRADVASELAPFAPLIGSWDLDVTHCLDDGTVRTVPGEWHFGWALDGRAVADAWITPRRDRQEEFGDGEWGMTIRFWDRDAGILRSTWHGPKNAAVLPFRDRFTEPEIVLEGEFEARTTTFSDITADGFRWRAEDEVDGRVTVRQRFAATRGRAYR